MTTANMRLRLAKIEASMKPRQPLTILFEPGGDAAINPVAWESHARDIAEARARGDRIGVVVFRGPAKAHEPVGGVEFFDTDWEAELAAIGPDALCELRDSLLGNIFGVANDRIEISD